MVGRYGSSELSVLRKVNDTNSGVDADIKDALHTLHYYSGFFPEDEKLVFRYAEVMKAATSQVDLMAIWFQMLENYELKKYGSDPEYCRLKSMEPFFSSKPWTETLYGKNVLVIHPFCKTIEKQYHNREKLFKDKRILPEFKLIIQPAVQTIAGNPDPRFSNWFQALDFMYEEAMKVDFDVAIIGCGAYGFPLAAKIKQAGKVAIHMAGSTQLLFGIKGKRWEEREDYRAIMNEYWVRPMEVPSNAENIEGGCYW